MGSVLKSKDLWCSQGGLAQKGDLQSRCSARSGICHSRMEGMAWCTKVLQHLLQPPSGS